MKKEWKLVKENSNSLWRARDTTGLVDKKRNNLYVRVPPWFQISIFKYASYGPGIPEKGQDGPCWKCGGDTSAT